VVPGINDVTIGEANDTTARGTTELGVERLGSFTTGCPAGADTTDGVIFTTVTTGTGGTTETTLVELVALKLGTTKLGSTNGFGAVRILVTTGTLSRTVAEGRINAA
jgi:hypothetical protein